MSDPILIVGGGPAALAAARGYRDAGACAHVVLVTDDDRPPYRRPALSKEFLRGELDASELALEEPGWYPAHDVEIVHDRVVGLDPVARRARTEGGRELAYEDAVLATGAEPVRPGVDGADGPGVRVLRTAASSEDLASVTGPETRVVVVGAGFIGCEAAVSLARRGARVTLVADEGVPQERRLGPDVGGRIASWLQQEGVELLLGAPIDAIDRGPGRPRGRRAHRRGRRPARLGRRAPRRPRPRRRPQRSARTAATWRSTRRWRPPSRGCGRRAT